MAEILYELNDPEDVQQWSKRVLRQVIGRAITQRWASEAGDTPLHVKTELSRGDGSTIKFHLRKKASGAGVKGDNELEGKEEGMTMYQETMIVDQLRHAVKPGGRMSQQRVTWDNRAEARDLLVDWWVERLETSYFNLACGNTVQTDDRYAGLNGTPSAATTIFRPDEQTDDANLTSAHYLDLDLIDKAINKAKIMATKIRPVRTDGGNYYIVCLHPNQVRLLRDTQSIWYGQMKAAMQGGAIANNPLFSGALGASNGAVFYETEYVTDGVNNAGTANTNVKRAVLLGASAICMGFGKEYSMGRFDWVERDIDYKNKLGVASGLIFGMLKPVFDSVDYGVIALPSWAPDPS